MSRLETRVGEIHDVAVKHDNGFSRESVEIANKLILIAKEFEDFGARYCGASTERNILGVVCPAIVVEFPRVPTNILHEFERECVKAGVNVYRLKNLGSNTSRWGVLLPEEN